MGASELPAGIEGARIKVSDRLMIGPALRRGSRTVHYLRKRDSPLFYRVGEREAFVIERLDGTKTVEHISGEYIERFHRSLSSANWLVILNMLGSKGLLASTESFTYDAQKRPRSRSRFGVAKLLSFRIPLARVPAQIARLSRGSSFMFARPVFASLLALSIGVCVYTAVEWHALWDTWRASSNLVVVTVAAYLVLWLAMVGHELAHGVACARYGGRAEEFGFMWRFPLFFPYCKVDDVLLFRKTSRRVITAFAGTYISLVATIPVAAIWFLAPAHTVLHEIAAAALLATVVGALAGLAPIFQLDGYAIINHALGMADLRSDTYQFWGLWLRRKVGRGAYPRRAAIAYVGYGALSAILVVGLVVGAVFGIGRMVQLTAQATLAAGAVAGGISLSAMLALVVITSRYTGSAVSGGDERLVG
jgi:putative peptide zinc metalloprotease protein